MTVDGAVLWAGTKTLLATNSKSKNKNFRAHSLSRHLE